MVVQEELMVRLKEEFEEKEWFVNELNKVNE